VNLPDSVQAYLANKMIDSKFAACVQVSKEGHYLDARGELEKYGIDHLKEGEDVCDRLSFLEGFFPLSPRSEVLPHIHISPQLIVDVHIISQVFANRFSPQSVVSRKTDKNAECGWILLLDTTLETRQQQQLQQQGNELRLLQQQSKQPYENIAGHDSVLAQVVASQPPSATPINLKEQDSALLSNVLSTLNLIVLECAEPTDTSAKAHLLSVIGQLPRWASEEFDCFDVASLTVVAEQFSPFLDNFIYDARSFWQEKPSPFLRSGVWTETNAADTEITLEAIALSIDNRSIILIERLETARSEKFRWLQTARENQLSFIEERKETASQIRNATSYDSLTGLPNRSLFISQLETLFEASQWSRDSQFALIVLNLDRFQLLNNSLGSEMGDQVLIAVANRIRKCLRQFDIPVRFSSDEFGILLGKVENEAAAAAIAQRLLETINQPFVINNAKTYFTASAGIAISAPWYRHSRDLLRDASLAMQAAKLNHRGDYVMFQRGMRTRAFELWNLESALDTAIENNELTLFYQPIVSLTSNKVEGFEALIRWNHPQKGHIPPAKFIPLAEDSGRILAIDNWVLKEACQTIHQWQQLSSSSACLNINISPQHFDKGDLFEAVQSAMQQSNIPPHAICLEITESCLLRDTQAVIDTLNRIKELGVQVAIDDFGTGYASLSYLQDLPLDKLKIDGYFVEMMKSNGSDIVNTVVELAHRLQFNVTAERVETVEQYQLLKQLGCDMGQGYLFSKPLPSQEAQSFIGAQVVVPQQKRR